MNDDWLAAAMTDDAVVVDLLFRLKQSPFSEACTPPPHPAATRLLHMRLPSPSWGHRQPRSKPTASASRKEAAAGSSARFSPTTPLSWSGGAASPSDGGFDESSRLPSSSDLTSAFRSKVNESSNVGSSSGQGQGCRRKKTFGDLVEEENSLLKERVQLKRELASLHVTLNQQKARSQDLKRIKIDLNMQSACDRGVGPRANEPSTQCNNPMQVLSRQRYTEDEEEEDEEEQVVLSDSSQNKGGGGFILPDLNMTPLEDEWN
ncbi:PREDICTED: uncharacterized protein LOC109159483 [Ipomoea nil]|uniref:uncharacterized protein LOC109159483 n=1 Tax=Ipomoea nil TaxID=35883 RepID=UPI0009009F1C|nr:PREDICTED: uncharacterized protein LOC109159483 [Ipomoea nil]